MNSSTTRNKLSYITFMGRVPGRNADSVAIMNTCAAFSRNGFDVNLFLPKGLSTSIAQISGTDADIWNFYSIPQRFHIDWLPGTILLYTSFPGKFLLGILYILQAMRKGNSIIYARHHYLALIAAALGCKTIYESHNFNRVKKSPLLPIMIRLINSPKKAFRLVTTTRNNKNEFVHRGVPEDKVFVSPNGVHPEYFLPPDDKSELRKSLNLPDDKPIICYSGSFRKGNGIHLLLECANQIDATFLIIGGSPGEIEKYEDRYKNVKFVGHVQNKEIPNYLIASDILLMPYTDKADHTYRSPMKMFDYLASGTPIISSDFSSFREVLNDGTNAFLVKPSVDEYVEKIRWLLNNPQIGKQLGCQGKKDSENYSWDQRGKTISKWIKKVFILGQ